MAWHMNINDTDFPLMDNKILTGSNSVTMLITSYDNLSETYNDSEIRLKCGNHFLFIFLPTLCEWRVQDIVFRSHPCPTYITTTYVISKFPRHKEWAERQLKKITNLSENQLKDLIKHHNKASQETLMHLINQIKNVNSKIDGMGQKKMNFQNVVCPLKREQTIVKRSKTLKSFAV